MTAYYNEIDPYAAQWLRNLIDAGHIAPGYIDERSIEDVFPNDLNGFTQCHFFAGVGVWSLALRKAGWPDSKRVWTGSCPCQPFSTAGKGKGFVDERHLWPAWNHLIEQHEPSAIFGEQVASKDGLNWIDLVQTDLEGKGYTFGANDICAAGIGAPHIRQRLWFFAEKLDNSSCKRLERHTRNDRTTKQKKSCRPTTKTSLLSIVANSNSKQREKIGASRKERRIQLTDCSVSSGIASNSEMPRSEQRNKGSKWKTRSELSGLISNQSANPTNGYWSDADWILCRDNKFRPVEPSTFPLVDGDSQRVGRLRAYGNAINVEVAKVFIKATMKP